MRAAKFPVRIALAKIRVRHAYKQLVEWFERRDQFEWTVEAIMSLDFFLNHTHAGEPVKKKFKPLINPGSRVKARWLGGPTFYKGVVEKANPDNTFDIQY